MSYWTNLSARAHTYLGIVLVFGLAILAARDWLGLSAGNVGFLEQVVTGVLGAFLLALNPSDKSRDLPDRADIGNLTIDQMYAVHEGIQERASKSEQRIRDMKADSRIDPRIERAQDEIDSLREQLRVVLTTYRHPDDDDPSPDASPVETDETRED